MKNFHLDIGMSCMSVNLKSLELLFTKRLTYTLFTYNRSKLADEASLRLVNVDIYNADKTVHILNLLLKSTCTCM